MLSVERLGVVAYAEALEMQRAAVAARRAARGGDRLLLLEHPPTITLGPRAKREHLKTPRATLRARGIAVHEVTRGGDVTYHGPGQLVGYLIADIKARDARNLSAWLRGIEGALMAALAELDVPTARVPGRTGVFVAPAARARPRKIASIGIGVRTWVTYHGFALNATLRDDAWDDIVPCGLHGVTMTSVARELAAPRATHTALFERCAKEVERAFLEALG